MFNNVGSGSKPNNKDGKKEELEKNNIGNYQHKFYQQHAPVSPDSYAEYARRKRIMIYYIILLIFAFFLFLGSSVWLVKFFTKGKAENAYEYNFPEEKEDDSSASLLPQGQIIDSDKDNNLDLGQELRAEDIVFGNYYNNLTDDFDIAYADYTLPIDSKVSIDNYYEISRKIDLDSHVEQLNKYGYAVIGSEAGNNFDFFSASRGIVEKDIPLLISDDFIIYFYQNKLKEFFKEIEKNVFYENIWDIYSKMHETALSRYEGKAADFGVSSDPLLQGSRLELSYLAVLLSLLEPEPGQVEEKANLKDDTKFSLADADKFSYNLPVFLRDDVLKELELIKAADQTAKSPVLLYVRDYTEFAVPEDYKKNAKLYNFYQALVWLNSQFPLFYKNDDCPLCLLDENDWRISQVAAGFLSEDISKSQELKNLWAIIYKFISFFSGLRHELTYLHYDEAYEDLFGSGYSIDSIYSPDNQERNNNFINIQKEIAGKKFLDIEGGYERSDENKKYIGMRLLQENYWPNDHIFGKLSGQELLLEGYRADKWNITQCPIKGVKGIARCSGMGLDIVNLLYPVKDNEYFRLNTNYSDYAVKTTELKKELDKFDLNAWNNNNYWATLDIGKKALYYSSDAYPVFMKDEKWRQEIGINTFLGAWTNMHVEMDELKNYQGSLGSYGFQRGCNSYNYVLPNSGLINELIAKTRMLMRMSDNLGLNKKDRVAYGELSDLERTLNNFKSIVKKELQGQAISDSECNIMLDFSNFNSPQNPLDKKFFIDNNFSTMPSISQRINGYKLLAVAYKAPDGKIVVAIGPIFNYQEKNR